MTPTEFNAAYPFTKYDAAFAVWMAKVDAKIAAKAFGLGSDDLPDCCYADWFEDGVSPSEAAAKAIKSAGG